MMHWWTTHRTSKLPTLLHKLLYPLYVYIIIYNLYIYIYVYLNIYIYILNAYAFRCMVPAGGWQPPRPRPWYPPILPLAGGLAIYHHPCAILTRWPHATYTLSTSIHMIPPCPVLGSLPICTYNPYNLFTTYYCPYSIFIVAM